MPCQRRAQSPAGRRAAPGTHREDVVRNVRDTAARAQPLRTGDGRENSYVAMRTYAVTRREAMGLARPRGH